MNYISVSLKSLLITALIIFHLPDASAQKSRKAIFVIADGIPADVLKRVKTPNLDAIAKVGGYSKSYVGGEKGTASLSPTISAVGYNSLLTGTWANKHNVLDNDIAAPNYHYWTIFRFFKEQYPAKKTAIFSTWKDNRTKLIGEGLPATGNIKLDYHFDGLELDTVNYPHDGESNYIHKIDEAVVNNAVEYLKTEAPDLSWVYLQYTDDMGHKYGDSEQFDKAVELMDAQIGRLWQAIQYRQKDFNEEWEIWITTDHGRDSETGKGHGGQSARERNTWVITNAQNLNDYFKSGKSSIVDIMPSIAQFLNVEIPHAQRMELDGIPLTGKLYAINPRVRLSGDELYISWRALDTKGSAKIWVSTTNHFPKVGKDNYLQRASVKLKDEEAIIDVSKIPGVYYKVVIETPGNMLNGEVRRR